VDCTVLWVCLFASLKETALKFLQPIALNERSVNVNEGMKTIGEKGGGNFIAGSVVYNLSRSRYGKRLVQSTTRDYGNARWLGRANGGFDGIFNVQDSDGIPKSIHPKGRISRTRSRKLRSNFRSQRRRIRSTGRGRMSSGLTRFRLEDNSYMLFSRRNDRH